MIPWSTIRPVLDALLASLSDGLPVVWIDEERPFIDPSDQAWILLDISRENNLGVDDRRYRDTGAAAPTYPFLEASHGLRLVDLTIRVEAMRQGDSHFSLNTVAKIASRLAWSSSRAALRAVEVAIVSIGEASQVPLIVYDQRMVSAASFRVQLCVGISDEDITHPVPVIESVEDPTGTYS